MVAVAAVLLVAMALFILGAGFALASIWHAAEAALRGEMNSTDLTVEFLEVVSLMLKAVIFYIIGVGLYSLFIAPLNVTTALGIETFNDLEIKIVSVIIVIMGVTFLEHFILWDQPVEIVLFGVSLSLVVAALVFFSNHSHRARQDLQREEGRRRARAQQELFEEEHEIRPSGITDDLELRPGGGRHEDHRESGEARAADGAERR
ncbi:MAG: YqhA family protein [Chloroflexota bacterium]|nr:YqhA family protein [Chloroflexota bacterium]